MPTVAEPDIRKFSVETLAASGVGREDAEAIAEGLIQATKRGVTTHGVFRLPQYSQSVRAGKINGKPNVQVLKRRGVTALVDADGGYGFRPSFLAADLAIEIAREHGAAVVGVRNSHHFGAAAIYTSRIAAAGLIGMATTTTRSNIAPTGAIGAVVGNNPLSIAVPRRAPNRPMVLDMALSQVAMGRVRVAAANGQTVPEGWGYDAEGRATTDPNAILANGFLAAIGEHKGYGLSVMFEVLAGALTGSPFGLTSNNHDHPAGGVGHFLLAIAPDFLRDNDTFLADIEELAAQLKASPLATGSKGVFLPGEIEDMKAAEADRKGLPVSDELVTQLEQLAGELGVAAPAWQR